MNGGVKTLVLVFVCGILAGFGVYAALSSAPGKIALYTPAQALAVQPGNAAPRAAAVYSRGEIARSRCGYIARF